MTQLPVSMFTTAMDAPANLRVGDGSKKLGVQGDYWDQLSVFQQALVSRVSAVGHCDPRGVRDRDRLDILQVFAAIVRFDKGRAFFEDIIRGNLGKSVLLSHKSLDHYWLNSGCVVQRGGLMYAPIQAVAAMLVKNGFKHVVLEEDDTCVNPFIQVRFDKELEKGHGRVVGFVESGNELGLKESKKDVLSFPMGTEKLVEHLQTMGLMANKLRAYVVQPVRMKGDPILVGCIPVAGSVSEDNVVTAWKYLKEEFGRHDIWVHGVCSDGDPRFVKLILLHLWSTHSVLDATSTCDVCGMKCPILMMCVPLSDNGLIGLQDLAHCYLKMSHYFHRAVADRKGKLWFGNKKISFEHFSYIRDQRPDLISKEDVSGVDQNYTWAYKLVCEPQYLEVLETCEDAIGTRILLKYCQMFFAALLSIDMPWQSRLRYIFISIVCIRSWRADLASRGLSLKQHFLSAGLYASMEIIAHSFVCMLRRCHMLDEPFSITMIATSQGCESLFSYLRCLIGRGMTFSMLDAESRMRMAALMTQLRSIARDVGLYIGKHWKRRDGDHRKAEDMNVSEATDERIEQILNGVAEDEGLAADLGLVGIKLCVTGGVLSALAEEVDQDDWEDSLCDVVNNLELDGEEDEGDVFGASAYEEDEELSDVMNRIHVDGGAESSAGSRGRGLQLHHCVMEGEQRVHVNRFLAQECYKNRAASSNRQERWWQLADPKVFHALSDAVADVQKLFDCPLCPSVSYQRKGWLIQHIRKKHGIDIDSDEDEVLERLKRRSQQTESASHDEDGGGGKDAGDMDEDSEEVGRYTETMEEYKQKTARPEDNPALIIDKDKRSVRSNRGHWTDVRGDDSVDPFAVERL